MLYKNEKGKSVVSAQTAESIQSLGFPRRRFLGLVAAASLTAFGNGTATAAPHPLRWRGTVMGAPATITLYNPDQKRAEAGLQTVILEIKALEGVFSLFRAESALSRLNRLGALDDAPDALTQLLARCDELHEASAGAFDPTVQPLWTLYAEHFSRPDAALNGPSDAQITAALEHVGFARVVRDGRSVRSRGTQLTLNGIAQGYLTDRARDILAAYGMPHALINLGEFRALGTRPDGMTWRLGISHPEVPWRTLAEVQLPAGAALATSASMGTPFDTAGRYHHLFDPRTGRCAHGWRSVTVQAPDATLADGLSTALAVAPQTDAARILAHYPGTGALLLGKDEKLYSMGDGLIQG